jgi:vancomycin resistance protein YoaR
MGYGIITGSDGVPKTVPSVAGGICQVATTAFQAAFWSGMEITNRNWHLYWIPNYGNGTGGLQGLDATVDADYDLDFTWVNPTDNWVAVRSYTDGANHHVEIWGTNQNWTVEVDEPVITNVVPADKETVHREANPEVQPGQEVNVETARDGFNAAIHRVVKDADGQVISDRTFESYYQPSRNVVLVAPGE